MMKNSLQSEFQKYNFLFITIILVVILKNSDFKLLTDTMYKVTINFVDMQSILTRPVPFSYGVILSPFSVLTHCHTYLKQIYEINDGN